jgi:CRISPR-associated protein Cas2
MSKSIYVISYDMRDDKKRKKIARYLETVGRRVQESVFETFATVKEIDAIIKDCAPYLGEGDDGSIRFYRVRARCAENFRQLGGIVTRWEDDIIV